MSAVLLSLVLTVAAPDDSPSRVRTILETKCTQCHGPNVAHPKGRFGFVTDLARLASDPRYIVPGDPDKSFLWRQIAEGEMPPEEAKAGPLDDQEKIAIHDWILAGAPTGSAGAPPPEPAQPEPPAPPRSFASRAAELVGKLHVLVIHFPIGLLVTGGLLESWDALRRRTEPSSLVRACLLLGASSAAAAAALGWLHASFIQGEPERLLSIHRWLGIAAASLALVSAGLSEWDSRTGRRRVFVRGLILLTAALVGLAGHFGGLLVYGSQYLSL